MVSVSRSGEQGTQDSTTPVDTGISTDGKFSVFQSKSPNLVRHDTNGHQDIFVFNRGTGRLSLASLNSAGDQANDYTALPSISGNGRYVSFESIATNLVTPHDPVALKETYVHDRKTGATVRASVSTSGAVADGDSHQSDLNGSGRYLAFVSNGNNLIGKGNDTNQKTDVFVRDLRDGKTEIASVSSSGGLGNGNSGIGASNQGDGTPGTGIAISADGRYVAFTSLATNLVARDRNGALQDVFVHDRTTGQTQLADLNTSGTQCAGTAAYPAISAHGDLVAFTCNAAGFAPGGVANQDVYVRNMSSGTTTLVSHTPAGVQGDGVSADPSISADGGLVAFQSFADDLVFGDGNTKPDVFLADLAGGGVTRLSISGTGGDPNGPSGLPSLSGDGRFAVFSSSASNLVTPDSGGHADVFLRGPLG
jgi:Tol biopolymer transport system component